MWSLVMRQMYSPSYTCCGFFLFCMLSYFPHTTKVVIEGRGIYYSFRNVGFICYGFGFGSSGTETQTNLCLDGFVSQLKAVTKKASWVIMLHTSRQRFQG